MMAIILTEILADLDGLMVSFVERVHFRMKKIKGDYFRFFLILNLTNTKKDSQV
jgi:hypothetical protein